MQFLCASTTLAEGQSLGFQLGETRLLAVRKDSVAFVYQNRCPHRGIPLEWQADQFLDHSGRLIQCASHGAQFLIESGECIAGPCAGQVLEGLECREEDGSLWVRL